MDLSATAAANGYQTSTSPHPQLPPPHNITPKGSPPAGTVAQGRPNLRVVIPNSRGHPVVQHPDVVSEDSDGENSDGGGGSNSTVSPQFATQERGSFDEFGLLKCGFCYEKVG